MKKRIIWGLLIIFVLIQFVRPEKNSSREWDNDYTTVLTVPDEVQEIIKTSCADCHSNITKYPWYSEIAPMSWYLANHVNNGKRHLNFSEWTKYNENQLNHVISDLEEVLESKEMPLKSYLILHEEAELSEAQYELLLNWVKSLK